MKKKYDVVEKISFTFSYPGDNESSWLLDDTPCVRVSAVDRLIPLSVALLTRGAPGNRNDLRDHPHSNLVWKL